MKLLVRLRRTDVAIDPERRVRIRDSAGKSVPSRLRTSAFETYASVPTGGGDVQFATARRLIKGKTALARRKKGTTRTNLLDKRHTHEGHNSESKAYHGSRLRYRDLRDRPARKVARIL